MFEDQVTDLYLVCSNIILLIGIYLILSYKCQAISGESQAYLKKVSSSSYIFFFLVAYMHLLVPCTCFKQARNCLIMLSVSYTGKKTHNIGKTSGVVRGGASEANTTRIHQKISPNPSKKAKKNIRRYKYRAVK